MKDTSKITVTVTVNHTDGTISVKRNGEKCPIALSYIVSPSSLAECYRDAAAYFLDLAAGQLNRYGLADAEPPATTLSDFGNGLQNSAIPNLSGRR